MPILHLDFKLPDTVDEMIKLSINNSQIANIQQEGIVVREKENSHNSFKAINPEFLLKFKL